MVFVWCPYLALNFVLSKRDPFERVCDTIDTERASSPSVSPPPLNDSIFYCFFSPFFFPPRKQQDYAYHATFPEFRSRAEGCGKQVLEVIQIFLNHVRQEGELGLPDVGDAGDLEVFQVWR